MASDPLRALIAGDEQSAPAQNAPAKKGGQLTKEAMLGYNDLTERLRQFQEVTNDLKPGTPTYQRNMADIAEAQKTLRQANLPVTPTAPAQVSAPAQPSDPLRALISGEEQPYTPANIDVNAQAQARLQRQGAQPKQKSAVGQAFQDAFDNIVMRPKDPGILANAIGAGEAGLTTASGALAYPLGAVAGIGGTLLSGKYGTQEGIQAGGKVAGDVASALTYQPRTQQGQGIVQNLQQLFEQSKLPPVGLPEAAGFAPVVGAASEQARNLKQPPQALGLQSIVQPGLRPASEVPAVMRKPANMTPQQIADVQAAFEAKKAGLAPPVEPVAPIAPTVAPISTAPAGSAGAAAATDSARIAELLSRASPELQDATKQIVAQGEKVNPQQLENRVKAEQFGIKLTEGEASQDLGKLSEEYNSIKQNPAMADHLASIPKKLSDAFKQIREKVAPDVNEPDPVKAANMALETMVQQDAAMRENISNKYKAAADLNGGELPLSGSNFVNTANATLKEANPNLYRFLPPEIQGILDDLKSNGNMSYNDFEYYRTILGNEERAAKRAGKDNVAFAVSKVRDALESTPMSEASAPVKAAYDSARKSAKDRFDLIKNNNAFKTAIADTRTPEEINLGVLHPAANTFVDKFYSHKTPDVQIRRLIDQVGQNSESHQGLNAAVIDQIAKASGVKGSLNDVISQAALNKQIRTIYKTNLGTMMPPEGVGLLNDLADVAALTEHTGAGKYSNVSKTAIAADQSPASQFLKKSAETLLHGKLMAVNPMLGVAYGAGKEMLKGRAERIAAEQAAAELAAKNAAPFKEGAGITYKLNDIKNLGSK